VDGERRSRIEVDGETENARLQDCAFAQANRERDASEGVRPGNFAQFATDRAQVAQPIALSVCLRFLHPIASLIG